MLIIEEIQGFGYNLMKNCPIKTIKVSNHNAFRVKDANYTNIS